MDLASTTRLRGLVLEAVLISSGRALPRLLSYSQSRGGWSRHVGPKPVFVVQHSSEFWQAAELSSGGWINDGVLKVAPADVIAWGWHRRRSMAGIGTGRPGWR